MIFSGGTRKKARIAPLIMRTMKPIYVPSFTGPSFFVFQFVAVGRWVDVLLVLKFSIFFFCVVCILRKIFIPIGMMDPMTAPFTIRKPLAGFESGRWEGRTNHIENTPKQPNEPPLLTFGWVRLSIHHQPAGVAGERTGGAHHHHGTLRAPEKSCTNTQQRARKDHENLVLCVVVAQERGGIDGITEAAKGEDWLCAGWQKKRPPLTLTRSRCK
jgi:hypothetical protein